MRQFRRRIQHSEHIINTPLLEDEQVRVLPAYKRHPTLTNAVCLCCKVYLSKKSESKQSEYCYVGDRLIYIDHFANQDAYQQFMKSVASEKFRLPERLPEKPATVQMKLDF